MNSYFNSMLFFFVYKGCDVHPLHMDRTCSGHLCAGYTVDGAGSVSLCWLRRSPLFGSCAKPDGKTVCQTQVKKKHPRQLPPKNNLIL